MPKPVQEAHDIVVIAKQDVNILLKTPELAPNLLELNTLFDRITTRLKYIGAIVEPTAENAAPTFGPITEFMGEKIVRNTKIAKGDLNPQAAELEAYRAKVQKLYDILPTTNPVSIIKSYTIAEDINVLRAVAKWAGVKDFKERKIDVAFVEEIILGIQIKEEEKAKQAEIDKEIKGPTPEVELTQEMIDSDPDLQKKKAVAGDLLITDAKGKKSIKKQEPTSP